MHSNPKNFPQLNYKADSDKILLCSHPYNKAKLFSISIICSKDNALFNHLGGNGKIYVINL